jgi:hypothetical protein
MSRPLSSLVGVRWDLIAEPDRARLPANTEAEDGSAVYVKQADGTWADATNAFDGVTPSDDAIVTHIPDAPTTPNRDWRPAHIAPRVAPLVVWPAGFGETGADSDTFAAPDADPCSCAPSRCDVAVLRPGLRCARGDCAGQQERRWLGHGDDVDFDALALMPSVSAPDGRDCDGPEAGATPDVATIAARLGWSWVETADLIPDGFWQDDRTGAIRVSRRYGPDFADLGGWKHAHEPGLFPTADECVRAYAGSAIRAADSYDAEPSADEDCDQRGRLHGCPCAFQTHGTSEHVSFIVHYMDGDPTDSTGPDAHDTPPANADRAQVEALGKRGDSDDDGVLDESLADLVATARAIVAERDRLRQERDHWRDAFGKEQADKVAHAAMMRGKNRALRAEIARLQEALAPFAAVRVSEFHPDAAHIVSSDDAVVTVGDLRRARAALNHTEK